MTSQILRRLGKIEKLLAPHELKVKIELLFVESRDGRPTGRVRRAEYGEGGLKHLGEDEMDPELLLGNGKKGAES